MMHLFQKLTVTSAGYDDERLRSENADGEV